jgi:hypothetical protein
MSGLSGTCFLKGKPDIKTIDVYIDNIYLKVEVKKEQPYVLVTLYDGKFTSLYSDKPPGFD